jgi:hypothetical protein
VKPFDHQVLAALAQCHALAGTALWVWPGPDARYALSTSASAEDIAAYEGGRRVPTWLLRRDLNCTPDRLSEAVRALERRGLVRLYGGDLSPVFARSHAKYVEITPAGQAHMGGQQ